MNEKKSSSAGYFILTFIGIIAAVCISIVFLTRHDDPKMQIKEFMDFSQNFDEQEISINVTAGQKIDLWNSIDIEYKDDIEFAYDVEIVLNEAELFKGTLDGKNPGVKIVSSSVKVNGNAHEKYKAGKIYSGLKIGQDGVLKVKAVPRISGSDVSVIKNILTVQIK